MNDTYSMTTEEEKIASSLRKLSDEALEIISDHLDLLYLSLKDFQQAAK